MFKFTRSVLTLLAFSLSLTMHSFAADGSTVKVALLDMTAMFGPSSGPGTGFGPGGMMGRGYGQGFGMMGRGMMGGMSIRTNTETVKAGKVTFVVSNLSRSIVHELVVVAVDNVNSQLPYDYNKGKVPEKQIKIMGQTEEMEPNAEMTIIVDLKPGSYLLICNVPGHYAADMWTPLTVTQ